MKLNWNFIKCIFKLPNFNRVFIKFIVKLRNCNKIFSYMYSPDSFIGTLETRLSRRSIVPLTPTIEKPRDASTNCDDTVVTVVDSTDQSNTSPQTSPIWWDSLPRLDKRDPFDSGSSRYTSPDCKCLKLQLPKT